MTFGVDTPPEVGKETQIKQGQVLNPNGAGGRPSKRIYDELMDMNLEDIAFDPELRKKLIAHYGNVPVRKAMGMKMLEQFFKEAAAKGMVSVHKEVVDRAEGKAVQALEVSGELNNNGPTDPTALARKMALVLEEGVQAKGDGGK